jgi:hypothetical protein
VVSGEGENLGDPQCRDIEKFGVVLKERGVKRGCRPLGGEVGRRGCYRDYSKGQPLVYTC